MNDLSDENLVAASIDGNKEAYALLIDRYYKQMSLICLGVTGNIHDAEDIAQETVLKGFLELSTLRDKSRFGSWLMKIARNLSVTYIAKKQRSKKLLAQNTVKQNIKTNRNENLLWAINQLPMEMRLPLVLYYFDGRSVQKVAESLNMSTSAVYSKLRISIKELHKLLDRQKNE